MLPQQYCLRWKYHHSNLQTMFSQLLDRGCFCDVTLACEGQLLRAHRVVLCACSSFFDTLLTNYSSERDPIVIMKDVAFDDVKCLIEFMYKGEINVEHSNLASLLKTADDLKIKGLAEVSWRDDEDPVAAAAAGSAIDYQQMRAYDMYTNGEQAANSHALHQQQQQQQQHHHQSLGAHTHAQAATHHGRHLHQPPSQQQHPHAHQQSHHGTTNRRRSPPMGDEEVRSPSDEAADLRKHHASTGYRRLPHGAPHSISIAPVLTAPPDGYLGPKRKRGRPPMDDSYDVFNIHKLAQYSSVTQADTAPQPTDSHAGHTIDERRLHPSAVAHASPPSSSTAAAAAAAAAIAYQQHVEHQAKQLSLRLRQSATNAEAEQQLSPRDPADDAQTDPEWINSNLEVNVAECDTPIEELLPENGAKDTDSPRGQREDALDVKDVPKQEQEGVAGGEQSKKERPSPPAPATAEQEDGDDDEAAIASGPVPQSVEDIENMHHVLEHQAAGDEQQQGGKSSASSGSGGTSPTPASVASTSAAGGVSQHKSSGAALPPPSPLMTAAAAAHFGKYMASSEGYLLNEHGMLMTHDFIHAPTVNIPTSSAALANAAAAAAVAAAAASNGHVNGGGGGAGGGGGEHDFADIKMEDYDAAELRLTSEEMTQWQDVIKMDDYLAKGRRPQFWEEPFTRRVLDAIKNKRLEMKKAARILGVSYGTLYGRYREVYGCLKHPYSSTTFRASQSSQLAAQPRFDMVWPSPKRDAALLAAGQLEVGKIRPKDLSELWTRPQI